MIDVLDDLADGHVDAHSSIVLTYNVDLLVYDKLLRRRLASAGATNQIVFCDARAYGDSLDEIDDSSKIGRAYSVTPVSVRGAFHPKAYLLLGARRGRLFVGSGNASLGGLVRNAELFGRFDFDEDDGAPPHPAFRAVVELARRLGVRAPLAVREQIERAEARSSWLRREPRDDGRQLRIGGLDGTAPLIDRIRDRVAREDIRRVVALSASFDRKLAAVRALADIGAARHETVVVVQPGNVTLDGEAVGALPDRVKWTEFADPRPSKRADPPDSHAHAKLLLIETASADHLFFGSANISRPALLAGDNVELLVELPPAPRGTWVERLGLDPSLTRDIRPALLELRWRDTFEGSGPSLLLAGVEWVGGLGWLIHAQVAFAGCPRLALAARLDRLDLLLEIEQQPDGKLVAPAQSPVDTVRFAWLVDRDRNALGAPVAVTWPEVARSRHVGSFGARVEQAILAVSNGELIGTIVLEFLDQVPDVRVFTARGLQRSPTRSSTGEPDASPRDEASFYTVAPASDPERPEVTLGDRSDFDVLAALIQPLGRPSRPTDDDDDDESVIAEEAERRGLDAAEPRDSSPTARRMRAAGRRFTRRVQRAALALEDVLEQTPEAQPLPPGLLARQVWMSSITALFAGHPFDTSDEGPQVVVDPSVFAHFVLRCAALLAGDAVGGLLRHIDGDNWPTRDGEMLATGLRFVVPACAWATAWFQHNLRAQARAPVRTTSQHHAQDLHDAAPLFVLARLLAASAAHVATLDLATAGQRIAAWNSVPLQTIDDAFRRAEQLATWIARVDADPTSATSVTTAVPGGMVVTKRTGVGLVLATRDDKLLVSMLSRARQRFGVFSAERVKSVAPPDIGPVLLAPVPASWLERTIPRRPRK